VNLNIFGFEIKKKKKEEVQTIVGPTNQDGSTIVSSSTAAYYSQVMDMDTILRNEHEMIRKYREISLHPECDSAIEEIVNEVVCVDDQGNTALLNLEDLKLSDSLKKKFQDEFEEIKYLINFDENAHDLFRSWYIDGRQYFVITLDTDNPRKGIQKIDKVDSRKIKKVKKIEKKKDPKSGVDVIVSVEEFFVYNERGIFNTTHQGIKLSLDSVVYCHSGLYDENAHMVLSYLHKAVKPVNQLKMLEDATVIYRISRAPERRIFYIDVGNLPRAKADQYITDIMNKFKNKIVYDASTGEIKDDRKHMSMLEDYWLPRREGGKGTEITTLPGGQNLSQIEDVNYFQNKVYQSLNVPLSRLQPSQNFTLGRSNEITRDEIKFNKFKNRLANKYSQVLIDMLKVQLISKNIVGSDDWEDIERNLCVNFIEDNAFVELKESELLMNRVQLLQQVDNYVGKYFSPDWVKINILKFTEDEIKQMDKEISAMPKEDDGMEAEGGEESLPPVPKDPPKREKEYDADEKQKESK